MRPRLGVLGGTFDPIHLGHIVLASEARWQLALHKVIFVPAGVPWRKAGREISSFEHRVEMTRLAAADFDAGEVSTLEGERTGPSYMAETLAQLSASNPDSELVLILGADALSDLPNWKDPLRIRELARLAVARRADEQPSDLTDDLEINMPALAISSTLLRGRVSRSEPIDYLTPLPVIRYIERHGLYRQDKPD